MSRHRAGKTRGNSQAKGNVQVTRSVSFEVAHFDDLTAHFVAIFVSRPHRPRVGGTMIAS